MELPDDLRVPLHSLRANLDWLVARLRVEDDEVCALLRDSIDTRLSQIESASYRVADARREALEEAETIVEEYEIRGRDAYEVRNDLANAIRKLIEK